MKKSVITIIFILFHQMGYSQNKFVDSLILWLQNNPKEDTMRAMTTHRLSYRLSEINPSESWKYAKETEKISKKINFIKGVCLANINYAIAHLPKKINANIGVNTNYTNVTVGKTLSYGFSTGANYIFANDKITLSEQFTWNKNAFNKQSNGSTLQNAFNINYQIIPHHSVAANVLITNNKSKIETINPTFTEFTGMVTYALTY